MAAIPPPPPKAAKAAAAGGPPPPPPSKSAPAVGNASGVAAYSANMAAFTSPAAPPVPKRKAKAKATSSSGGRRHDVETLPKHFILVGNTALEVGLIRYVHTHIDEVSTVH